MMRCIFVQVGLSFYKVCHDYPDHDDDDSFTRTVTKTKSTMIKTKSLHGLARFVILANLMPALLVVPSTESYTLPASLKYFLLRQ